MAGFSQDLMTSMSSGVLTAAVRGPSRPIPVNVRDRGDGKPKVHFTPEEEGKGRS